MNLKCIFQAMSDQLQNQTNKQESKQFQGRQNVRKQNNFMRNQSPSKQVHPESQQIRLPRREGSKYQQLLAKLQQEQFYDDGLFFDKKNAFNMVNPNTKKFKTIYHKIILSNKSDPLHPSSYRRFESSQHARYQRNKGKFEIDKKDKFSDSRLRIQLDNTDRSKAEVLESIRQKMTHKEEPNATKDRKRFFNNLFKKFTQNYDQDTSIHYKQKVHLFKKIFEHYKIKPEEREHFEEILRKLTEKDSESWAASSKISTKMNLELRRNNNSVSEKRTDSPNNPRLKIKEKSTKTSHQKRNPKECNFSHILSVEAKASKQEHMFVAFSASQAKTEQKHITELENQLSARREQFKTVQEQSQRLTLLTHTQHRTRVLDKKLNISNLNQSVRQETPIDIKLQKFRQFLFAINFGNHLFVPLEVDKYHTLFKIFVGKGNNSNLIKAIFKKRFWFEVTKNINEANLIWTQLKEQHVFERQQPKKYMPEKEKQLKTQEPKQCENPSKQKLQTQQPQQNPQPIDQPIFDDQNLQQNNSCVKQNAPTEQSRILDFRSLKLKQRPNLSKFVSVQSERFYRSQAKAQKPPKQINFQENSLKMKKYPQLLALRDTHLFAKDPLSKILCPSQMAQYNELYAKYLKNPLKMHGTKVPSFEERRKDILASANGQTLKEQDKQQIVIHNHLPFNGILGNKKAMFYILREYCTLTGRNLFNTVPLTFHIKQGLKDEEYKKFAQQFESRRKSNKINYWVMKPGEFSNRGNGIECTNKLEYVRKRIQACAGKVDPKRPKAPLSTKSIILQSYITDLLLYNGRKFDIRTYMMVTIANGKIKAYWYQEGYIRTSSYMWNLSEIEDREIHLTNDAVQKYSDTYGKYQLGNKLSYRDIQRYLETYEKASKNVVYDKILPQMKEIAALSLKAAYMFLDPSKLQNNFQIFGFDFMLDTKLKPWLIEINTNPCLQLGCPILQRIIPNMLQNAFRIAVDPLFPPPSSFSSNYKYNIAQNAVNYNKFELIFDEDRDGPDIRKLYESKSLEDILAKIEDIQEDKEVFEEDGEQIELGENK